MGPTRRAPPCYRCHPIARACGGRNTARPCSLTPPPRRRSQLFQPTHQLLSPSLGLHFDDIPGGIAAIDSVPAAGWLQIIALVGVHELTIAKQDYTKEPGEIPTFLGFKSEDPEVFRNKQLKELKNGRLAMIAVLGELMAQKVPVAHRHAQTRAHARRHARRHTRTTHARTLLTRVQGPCSFHTVGPYLGDTEMQSPPLFPHAAIDDIYPNTS